MVQSAIKLSEEWRKRSLRYVATDRRMGHRQILEQYTVIGVDNTRTKLARTEQRMEVVSP